MATRTKTPRREREPVAKSQPIHVPKAAEIIAEKLRRRIVLGELKAGDALPAEAEMMLEFSVSRSSLREAFRVLEAESLIEVKRGAGGGARIKLPKDEIAAKSIGTLLQIRGASLKEVLEARLIIEPPLMRALATTRTDDDLKALRDHLAKERDNLENFNVFALATAEFHRILMQRAGNVVLALMTGMLDDIFRRHVTHFIARAREDQLELNKVALANHTLLTDMIESRNAEAAAAVWRQHMQQLKDIVLGELGEASVLDLYGGQLIPQ
ncbi:MULTISPECIES: FadR/GntR family transcriptional regulator [Sphingopyxis]|uniref:Transcriptional regulator, GntR family n=1 Tax=Sphingopyxis granuli TaxID=267128 RepID=A0AA86GMQ9_9SPHN|nr:MULTISPECIES: FCD domain-containing protein [Sphingopyxis]AMG74855.1 Transcriptional regulator, GntR family [Sphingopyxis granuli]